MTSPWMRGAIFAGAPYFLGVALTSWLSEEPVNTFAIVGGLALIAVFEVLDLIKRRNYARQMTRPEGTDMSEAVERAREAYNEAREAEREAEIARVKHIHDTVFAEHNRLVAEVTGFRRAILEYHGPCIDEPTEKWLYCKACPADYAASHPCGTYQLARDWTETP